MKTVYKIFFYIFFLVSSCLPVHSQSLSGWHQTSGPEEGTVNTLLFHENRLFAGCGSFSIGGIFISDNTGESWSLSMTGVPVNEEIHALAAYQDTLFVGTQTAGIFKSADNGETWIEANTGLGSTTYIRTLEVHDSILLAGTFTGGIFRSVNGGRHWDHVGQEIPVNNIPVIVSSNEFIFAGTNGGGIYRSADQGNSWTAVNTGLTGENRYVFAMLSADSVLFAGTLRGVFRSTDNGLSWFGLTSGLPASATVASFSNSGENVYVSFSNSGIYKSNDYGDSWTMLPFQNPSRINSILSRGDTLLSGVETFGVYRSPDGGITWQKVSYGLSNTSVYTVKSNKTDLFCGTLHADFGYVWRSGNQGKNWTAIHQGLSPIGTVDLLVWGDTLFAATNGNGVYRSANNGDSWERVMNGLPAGYIESLAATGTYIFAGSFGFSQGIFRSADFGETWEAANNGLIPGNINDMDANDSLVFATVSGAGIYRSRNNGSSWQQINNGLNSQAPETVTLQGNLLYAGMLWGGIFKSSDFGDSWNQLDSTTTPSHILELYAAGSNLYAATRDSGLYLSRDEGLTWKKYNEGLPPGIQIFSLHSTDSLLYAGCEGLGVWKRKTEPATTIETVFQNRLIPGKFRLFDNHPNPFNPQTWIDFQLFENQAIILRVYNITGQLVKTLVNSRLTAGNHSVIWDGTDHSGHPVSSGVYFYQLKGSGHSETGRMLLLR